MANQITSSLRPGQAVVLVEDDDSLRRALLRVLAAAGFLGTGYASAEDLLADTAIDRAACLVVDLNLPAMSGLALIDQLHRRGWARPVVAISAHDEPHVHAQVSRCGSVHFLGKPFPGSTLVGLLNALLCDPATDRLAPKGKPGCTFC